MNTVRPLAFVAVVAAGTTVAMQIVYPLVHGDTRRMGTIASVVAFFVASVAHAGLRGRRSAVALVAVCAGGGLVAEAVGVHTGVPFGRYSYTGTLGWQVAGVPVVVGLAWAMFGWVALAAGRRTRHPVAVGAALLVTWDLFLDPQMVDAGHWRWEPSSWPALHGIPLSNSVGWAVVAVLLLGVLHRVAVGRPGVEAGAPAPLPWLPLALLGWTWFSETLGHAVFFDRPAVAVTGGVAMGAALVPVLRTLPHSWSRRPAPGGRPS